jgi:hypothetical protein
LRLAGGLARIGFSSAVSGMILAGPWGMGQRLCVKIVKINKRSTTIAISVHGAETGQAFAAGNFVVNAVHFWCAPRYGFNVPQSRFQRLPHDFTRRAALISSGNRRSPALPFVRMHPYGPIRYSN